MRIHTSSCIAIVVIRSSNSDFRRRTAVFRGPSPSVVSVGVWTTQFGVVGAVAARPDAGHPGMGGVARRIKFEMIRILIVAHRGNLTARPCQF